jgi:DNA-directed RNA polymerase subunit RPC12/RpoP
MKTVRCTACESEFTNEEIKGKTQCPSCSSTRLPMDIAHDILLPINWHELRCLTIWASRWADTAHGFDDESRVFLQKLLNKINKHRPNGGGALTLQSEIKELQKYFPSSELTNGNGETIIPPLENKND